MTQSRVFGGRYELGSLLGYGGMAEVLHGRDTRLDRDVAVKVLRSDLARDQTFQARFRREAQAAAALNHPSIVAVYDTGADTVDGVTTPYIVMEYVEGRTLRDLLKAEKTLQTDQAMLITSEICAALDFSHRNGIVHRDVKPGNVMITNSGRVKVMDFGIARAVSDSAATMTATAAVIGTAQYLSPEQARGENVDARSDVYAVGCVLYELLTGAPPFVGDSPVAVAYQHVRENPKPPSAANPSVPRPIDAIVLKALSKNPANRYQSAAQMQEDLSRALEGRPVEATPVMTEEEATTVIPTTPPPPVAPSRAERAAAYDDDPKKRGTHKGVWAVVIVAVIAAVVAAFILIPKLTAADAPPKVAVPSLTGMTVDQATAALDSAGLKLGKQTAAVSAPGEKDKIISQDPSSDSRVDKNTPVDIQVGSGPNTQNIPEIVGLSKEDAQAALTAAHLKATFLDRDSAEPADTVVDSSPKSGEQVVEDSVVTVFVSTGQLTLPNVIGKSYDDAVKILNSAGFNNVQESNNVDPAVAAKSVVTAQTPDTPKATPTNTITLTVDATVPLPNVIGKDITSATQILNAAGFNTIQVTEVEDANHPAGEVIAQDPVTPKAAPDTPISLSVAKAAPPASPSPPSSPSSPSKPPGG